MEIVKGGTLPQELKKHINRGDAGGRPVFMDGGSMYLLCMFPNPNYEEIKMWKNNQLTLYFNNYHQGLPLLYCNFPDSSFRTDGLTNEFGFNFVNHEADYKLDTDFVKQHQILLDECTDDQGPICTVLCVDSDNFKIHNFYMFGFPKLFSKMLINSAKQQRQKFKHHNQVFSGYEVIQQKYSTTKLMKSGNRYDIKNN